MRRQKDRTLSIGSVSSGTMREEDLIPCFLSVAEDLRLSREDRASVRRIRKASDVDEDAEYWQDGASEDCSTLFDLLGRYVPEYCYFGAIEGDGAEYGCFVLDSAIDDGIHDGDVLVQDDSYRGRQDVIPVGFSGYLLRVSDHGNRSLYRVVRGRRLLVW